MYGKTIKSLTKEKVLSKWIVLRRMLGYCEHVGEERTRRY